MQISCIWGTYVSSSNLCITHTLQLHGPLPLAGSNSGWGTAGCFHHHPRSPSASKSPPTVCRSRLLYEGPKQSLWIIEGDRSALASGPWWSHPHTGSLPAPVTPGALLSNTSLGLWTKSQSQNGLVNSMIELMEPNGVCHFVWLYLKSVCSDYMDCKWNEIQKRLGGDWSQQMTSFFLVFQFKYLYQLAFSVFWHLMEKCSVFI